MEIDSLLKQALVVTDTYSDYDPSTQLPTTGDDFLRYVMHEKTKYKEVVRVQLDGDSRNDTINYNISQTPGCVRAPDDLCPSKSWQQTKLAEFHAIRQRIDRLREKDIPKTRPVVNAADWQPFCENNQPILTTVLALSQPDLDHLIGHLAEWLEEVADGNEMDRYIGVWIYAVLSCIAIPLLPDTFFELRQIARRCSQLRAALPPAKRSDEYVRPLNLIICLVSRYFNQTDLADDW